MNDRELGQKLGEYRKQAALDLLEMSRADYVLLARRALLESAMANGTATADDVRDSIELPPGMNPKLFGSVPGALVRAGIIRRVGFETTCRPMAHARPIGVWAIRDPAKAESWLQTNKPAEPTAIGPAGNLHSPNCESEESENAKVSI